jgi:hypothetical protein
MFESILFWHNNIQSTTTGEQLSRMNTLSFNNRLYAFYIWSLAAKHLSGLIIVCLNSCCNLDEPQTAWIPAAFWTNHRLPGFLLLSRLTTDCLDSHCQAYYQSMSYPRGSFFWFSTATDDSLIRCSNCCNSSCRNTCNKTTNDYRYSFWLCSFIMCNTCWYIHNVLICWHVKCELLCDICTYQITCCSQLRAKAICFIPDLWTAQIFNCH